MKTILSKYCLSPLFILLMLQLIINCSCSLKDEPDENEEERPTQEKQDPYLQSHPTTPDAPTVATPNSNDNTTSQPSLIGQPPAKDHPPSEKPPQIDLPLLKTDFRYSKDISPLKFEKGISFQISPIYENNIGSKDKFSFFSVSSDLPIGVDLDESSGKISGRFPEVITEEKFKISGKHISKDEIGEVELKISVEQLSAKKMAVGEKFVCASVEVIPSHERRGLICWGMIFENKHEEYLRDHDYLPHKVSFSKEPSFVFYGNTNQEIKMIAAGKNHVCLAFEDGLWCMGENYNGQLGTNSFNSSEEFKKVYGDLFNITSLSAGDLHTCAIANNKIFCWGNNDYGQVGLDQNNEHCFKLGGSRVTIGNSSSNLLSLSFCQAPNEIVFPQIEVSKKSVKSGMNHNCALIQDNQVYCWGDNSKKQINYSESSTLIPQPIKVQGLPTNIGPIKELASKNNYNCVLYEQGEIYCWGEITIDNKKYTLRPTNFSNYPNPIRTKRISLGQDHICTYDEKYLYCWGGEEDRHIGANFTDESNKRSKIDLGHPITSLEIGNDFSCALAGQLNPLLGLNSIQGILCWGNNDKWQLGIETRSFDLLPPTWAIPWTINQ